MIEFDYKKKQWIGLSAREIEKLQEKYPLVHVVSELQDMAIWLTLETSDDVGSFYNFIHDWLADYQDLSEKEEAYRDKKTHKLDI
jgi:hypothetical protein